MIGYASRTGTRRNLAALRAAGWRLLVSATGCLRSEGFAYGLDNGAWTAYRAGKPFDDRLFLKALDLLGRDADWVVLPDMVAGGMRSFEMSMSWMKRVLDMTQRCLFPAQDGMEVRDFDGLLGDRVGIFVGGSTDWKVETVPMWSQAGKQAGAWVHVGRVNTASRVKLCRRCRVTSFDGTSATRYAVTLGKLDAARDPWTVSLFDEEEL